jgi:N-acetylglucosamine-6-phosphate deacetylase
LTEERVTEVLRAFERFGVTRICPTVTTEGFAVLRHALATIAAVCEHSPAWARRMPGIHLEGPFITSEDGARGAHPKRHCRQPDWDEFQRLQEAAGGRIRILTMSPEFDNSTAFIKQVAATGVVVAIGHTSARPEQIRAAVDAGARMSTHLGNGSHPTFHRFRNYLWPQLADDRLSASLIADGHHLPPDMVKVFLRAKTPERCILVSDISGQAGQPPGRYTSPFCDVEILPDGNLVVAGQREIMAGASLPANVGVHNVMRFAGVDLKTALQMAVHNPAELLGLGPIRIAPDEPANLIQFDVPQETGAQSSPGLRVRCTISEGEMVWGDPWQGD